MRQSAQGTPGVPAGLPITRDYELFDVGFDASWELDLFGRVRRLNESARAAAQAAAAARNQVALSVIAEVARNYFELRGAQTQLAVARSNADNQSQRARAGATRGSKPAAAPRSTRRARPRRWSRRSRACRRSRRRWIARMRRIAVLTGAQPGMLADRLVGRAARCLRCRRRSSSAARKRCCVAGPTCAVAERQLAAATANIGVAGRRSLSARDRRTRGIGLTAPRVSQLDDAGNDRRSFGPALSWGLLDFGHVYHRIRAAGARNAELLANYEQTVLLALEETENALSDFSRERQRLEHLTRAAEASRSAADLAGQRFEGGVSDFLTALDAYRTSLEAEDQLAISQTRTATTLVTIYKALGGGWEIAPPP